MNSLLAKACVVVALAVGVSTVAWSRPQLANTVRRVKETTSVYNLPPPSVLARASLGYRSAVADYLWAHVLVTQGLRMGEKRTFSEVAQYLDAINFLDPRFRPPYRFADTLLIFQVDDPDRAASAREARRLLERGITQFPYDAELYLTYGQFLAYLGPGLLPADSDERSEWQNAGAQALIRAGELTIDENTAFKAIPAAAILKRKGEHDAAISVLERLYTVTDNEEVREDIVRRLLALRQGEQASQDFQLSRKFDSLWRQDLPFAPRSWLSLLGPPHETWKCAGPSRTRESHYSYYSHYSHYSQGDAPCVMDWPTWSEHMLRTMLRTQEDQHEGQQEADH